jgi:hypothetical protein
MSRRKIKEKNIRKITKVGGASYAVTLPVDIIRRWRWKEKQKVVLKINKRSKTITIKDWKKKKLWPKQSTKSKIYQKLKGHGRN